MPKALFLDRDGVINVEVNYAHRVDQMVFVEGIFALCRAAKKLGYLLIVVTNQSGIARGLYTQRDFEVLTAWITEQFAAEGVVLDATYHSPFGSPHEDHKPSPGMLLRAERDFGLDLGESILVGDRCSDVGAANNAGLRQAFLLAGTESVDCPGECLAVRSLAEVGEWLERNS